ncbi:MAG: tRNA (adenosine(37)-N6)-dimethylallyltransferase MiaA [Candidatus Paceibacterota bacterium]|jgi:tRNA dimethylallyltransferase
MLKFLNRLKIKNYKIKNSNRKLLVILGPTASGKSELAIKLAQLFNGEIISADSRQVYRGMDIGSGKVPISYESRSDESTKSSILRNSFNNGRREIFMSSSGIRHHLLDVADPQEYFSVSQYQQLATQAIQDIQKRGKLPILCGGTALYILSVIEGWQLPKVPPNYQLREELEHLSAAELFQKLQNIDPKRAKTIDPQNKRRLIRALEIAKEIKSVPPLNKKPRREDILILGIKKERSELQKLIKKRLIARIDEGMIQEVQNLKNQGVSSKRLEDFGLEYRWVNRYLENKISYKEMIDNLSRDTFHYAKRQMTLFKKIPNIHWLETEQQAINLVKQWFP